MNSRTPKIPHNGGGRLYRSLPQRRFVDLVSITSNARVAIQASRILLKHYILRRIARAPPNGARNHLYEQHVLEDVGTSNPCPYKDR